MKKPALDYPLLRARSYDDVAEAYERVSAPLFFDAPARALVECAELSPGARVLDVGAGTGAVSRAALAAGANVAAVDPSSRMLLAAGRGGVRDLVGGAMPNLPFLDGVFDAVVCAFVMTHVDEPDDAVRDMHRVLRKGGCAALSAWSPADDEYARAWSAVVHEFVAPDVLAEAAGRVLPGEPRFSRSGGLAELLATNDFAFVQTVTRSFSFAPTVDQMIETREVCASGRALRMLLSDAEWKSCRERLRTVLGKKFPSGIHYDRAVYFAVGRRS